MKKITIIASASALILASIFTSCKMGCVKGSGHQATETRKTGDFSRLDIEGGFKVVLKQDSSEMVTINADDNLMKYIRTNMAGGGRLKIYTRKNLCSSGIVTITVGVRNLDMIRAAGAIEVHNEGKLTLQDLKLDLTGSDNVNLDMNAANVEIQGAGSNEVHLKGQGTSLALNMSGSGKLLAFDFPVGRGTIKTAGAADVEINALTSLEINSAGAADVKYKGNPSIQQKKAGALSVSKVD